ncbi:hypothetical protein [Hyunsoonleella ulvae]|uniref:hypothetical protein n=1 Tax=Hyunsoonleella ulvae TaxID=2799948 RepID=UPI0019397CEF|nr:hypothetical protein [Hyunsoonleella ulvae]
MIDVIDRVNISGNLCILSTLPLDELASIVSEKIFNNLQFGGKELKIRDEFEAVFIPDFLGFRIVLMDNGGKKYGSENQELFWLQFKQKIVFEDSFEGVRINSFLFELFKKKLNGFSEIEIIKSPIDKNKYPNLE